MRSWLICLAIIGGIVVANPFFWSVLRMNFAAEPVTYIEGDGTMTQAVLGPRAPWPDWILAPAEARLVVASYFAPSGEPADGVGAFHLKQAPIAIAESLVYALERDGWRVETATLETATASLPPQPMTLCSIAASRDAPQARTVRYSFDTSAGARKIDVYWRAGETPPPEYVTVGPCSPKGVAKTDGVDVGLP